VDARLSGKTLLKIALLAIPGEMVSLFLCSLFPIDVGYPPGTNPIWYISLIGVWLHMPGFLAGGSLPGMVFFGYLDIVVISVVLLFAYRGLKDIVAKRLARRQ